MIVNRNVIHDEILKQTLKQEVSRLSALCGNRQLSYLEQKIYTLENALSYEAYAHNQKISSHRVEQQHQSRRYAEALSDKKQRDVELRQSIEANRNGLSKLQRIRKELNESRKKVMQAEQESKQIAAEVDCFEQNLREQANKAEEEQYWIKRLKTAEDLCRSQINTQQEHIKKLQAEIKIEKIGHTYDLQSIQELRKEVDSIRAMKETNYRKMNEQQFLFDLQIKECLAQESQLTQEKQIKAASLDEYQRQIQTQDEALRAITRQLGMSEEISKDLESKTVAKMNLIEQMNNQMFEIKVNRTNCKVKTKETFQKIERLRRLKGELFELIC